MLTLCPCRIAIRDSRPGSFMTSYNKVNGVHVNEDPKFVQKILRGEWNWEGMVMSDWYGTYSTTEAIAAGLDLEMPGPSRWRGGLLKHALISKKITQKMLDDRVREVLKLVSRVSKIGVPENAPELSRNTPETSELLREIAGEAIVLLKNDGGVLPFKKETTVRFLITQLFKV